MKKDLTELVFIIDRSGSMYGMEADTVGGFNSMIEKQRGLDGDVMVSTVLFSTDTEVLHDRVPIERVEPMTVEQYRASGGTALLDAIGGAIHHIGNVHKYARDEDRPEHTLFIITTDGIGNSSREYGREQVKKMIRRQEERYGWEFMFVAANIDAVETAEHIGIRRERAANYKQTRRGTQSVYEAVDLAVTAVRCCAPMGEEWKDKLDDGE